MLVMSMAAIYLARPSGWIGMFFSFGLNFSMEVARAMALPDTLPFVHYILSRKALAV